jgi:O-methyltransferase domain
VIDLAPGVEHGAAVAAGYAYADIVTHEVGDARTHVLPDADVVLMSNLLHHFTTTEIQGVLSRVRLSVKPGGTAAIWEVDAPGAGDRPSHGDVAALYFRLTSTAATPPGESYARWLRESGFREVTVRRPRLSPGRVLVVARG